MAFLLGPDRYLGETRDQRQVAGLTLTETVHRRPARLPLHTHEAPYFCLVLDGAFDERVGDSVSAVRSGELLFHPPGETHANDIRSADTRLLNIALGGPWSESLARLDGATRPRPGRQGAAPARVARRIARELFAGDSVSALAIEGLALTLIAEAAPARAPRGGPPRWLPVARDFIHAHFRERLDHDALARVAGVHATHLARAFHAHVGCSVTSYVHRLRIEWARDRIALGDESLAALALDAGFADQPHFTRVFRRQTGATPSEYRCRSRCRRA